MCKPNMYLKSISATIPKKEGRGDAYIHVPMCLLQCTKKGSEGQCEKFIEDMVKIPCSQFDMEFDVQETAGIIWAKKSLSLFLTVGVVVFLSLLHCCKRGDTGYTVSVVCNALPGTTGMVYTVSYSGADIDTNKFADVVKASIPAGKGK